MPDQQERDEHTHQLVELLRATADSLASGVAELERYEYTIVLDEQLPPSYIGLSSSGEPPAYGAVVRTITVTVRSVR